MKPLHIVILVAAGAIGGGAIMKVAQKPQGASPAPLVAQAQTPPATAPGTLPAAPVREAPKPGRRRHAAVSQPPAVIVPLCRPEAQPAPKPAPQPVPPARIEPENVTPPPGSAPPEPYRVTLNAGTRIPVDLVDG